MWSAWSQKQKWGEFSDLPEGEFPSHALKELVEDHIVGRGVRILDLGGAQEENIRFYSNYSTKIHIADIYPRLAEIITALKQHKEHIDENEVQSMYDAFFESEFENLPKGVLFDVVFFWDILNYIDPAGLRSLGRALAPHTHPNTVGMAVIAALPKVPAEPIRFHIKDSDCIRYERTNKQFVTTKCHSKPDLQKHFCHFQRTRSYLKRNGMEEFLFKRTQQLALPAGISPQIGAVTAEAAAVA